MFCHGCNLCTIGDIIQRIIYRVFGNDVFSIRFAGVYFIVLLDRRKLKNCNEIFYITIKKNYIYIYTYLFLNQNRFNKSIFDILSVKFLFGRKLEQIYFI